MKYYRTYEEFGCPLPIIDECYVVEIDCDKNVMPKIVFIGEKKQCQAVAQALQNIENEAQSQKEKEFDDAIDDYITGDHRPEQQYEQKKLSVDSILTKVINNCVK